MTTTIPVWVQLAYLAAAVCFILALKGLSSPKTARRGNLLGAVAAAGATVVVFFQDPDGMDHVPLILVAIAIGTAAGFIGAYKVQMTQMPQLVALFNGVGGGAAALVALLELHEILENGDESTAIIKIATVFTIFVGAVSFAGSAITFAKLQELMTTRPVVFPGLPIAFGGSFVAA
ncbi:MAG: NAD(P)(+) transhydrogenase (Re/Si-specific) subunit beta, partial [Aeromicrobium sp.]